jgi:DNA uptake protein ComE-like DNA-binding protein
MRRFLTALMVAIASLGLALGSASALAQKAETPKDAKSEARKADTKADAKKTDAKSGTAAGGSSAGALIDINTASEKELASLPGIGDARATAIVKNRPYKGKNELKDRKIIPESVYNGIQDKVIAKQDAAAAKKDAAPAAKKDAAPAPKKDEKKK